MAIQLDHNATPPMHSVGVDAADFSAHELSGPRQVAGTVGPGKAARSARLEMDQRRHYLSHPGDAFDSRLVGIPGSVVTGQRTPRLPDTTFFAPPHYPVETLNMELDRAQAALSCVSTRQGAVTAPGRVSGPMAVDATFALNAMRVAAGMDDSQQDVENLAARFEQLKSNLPALVRRAAG